jgi:hypothetical protein
MNNGLSFDNTFNVLYTFSQWDPSKQDLKIEGNSLSLVNVDPNSKPNHSMTEKSQKK